MKKVHKFIRIKQHYSEIMIMLTMLSIVFSTGCRKFVEIQPTTSIVAASVYSTNTSAAAAMTGIYIYMEGGEEGGLTDGAKSVDYLQGLAADELTLYVNNPVFSSFYQNALSSSTGGASNYYYWPELYNELHAANAVIAGLEQYQGVTPDMKKQLTGEALFMRAFLHFYAASLYGNVPVITTTDYLVNEQLSQTPQMQVYQQCIQDLKQAQSDLSDNFVDATGLTTTQRIRPNKGAATALLARVYLCTKDWKDAAIQASAVIGNSNYSLNTTDLTQVFLANSTEAIWQMAPAPGYNTNDATFFVLTSPPGTGTLFVSLSPSLINAFEPGDKRFQNWTSSYTDTTSGKTYFYPYKYKVYQYGQPVTEYKMIFRLAEQYLIRAEAEANNNDLGDAINDLNVIRKRAGLGNYSGAVAQAPVQAAILHERQVELFTEWGDRWFSLIRTGNINSVMGNPGGVCAAKGGTWNPDWALMPLPLGDLQIDHNLKQNPGY